jgi:hypothetical protein
MGGDRPRTRHQAGVCDNSIGRPCNVLESAAIQLPYEDAFELLGLEFDQAARIDLASAQTDMAAEPGARPCARWYGRQKAACPAKRPWRGRSRPAPTGGRSVTISGFHSRRLRGRKEGAADAAVSGVRASVQGRQAISPPSRSRLGRRAGAARTAIRPCCPAHPQGWRR